MLKFVIDYFSLKLKLNIFSADSRWKRKHESVPAEDKPEELLWIFRGFPYAENPFNLLIK